MLAAAHARQEGITVNVVGVVDYGTIGELGSREIADIAKAGAVSAGSWEPRSWPRPFR